jgi:hypothetical protein
VRAVSLATAPVLALAAACGTASIGDPPLVGGDASSGDDGPRADAPPPPDARPCTGGDARAQDPATGTCYVYVHATATWEQARDACVTLGGHLATPTSAPENALVTGLPIDPATLPDVWLGGTDADEEGTWVWITGEPWDYENWRTGEPNDGASPDVSENCLILEADTDGTWDDRPCQRAYPYLCERP